MLEDRAKQGKPANQTISAYINALLESYLFYEIKRFDIKGKEELKTLGKYYIVDIGLRNYLLGYRDIDTGHMLENVVYFELLRRGYDVAVGKIGNKEIDFIATKDGEKIYYQVTEDMTAEPTRSRELECSAEQRWNEYRDPNEPNITSSEKKDTKQPKEHRKIKGWTERTQTARTVRPK